ncbi:hypothetical protein [Streptomyces sp. NPDC018711]|uniref:hypothetical protein n=1 Tax=Streptomyces sp. NPDC018711 TaxID=3365052 RepID=UPI0037A2CE9B
MSTQNALLILAAAVAVLVAAGFLVRALLGTDRGASPLERRFGLEYERTLARHGGDTESAHRAMQLAVLSGHHPDHAGGGTRYAALGAPRRRPPRN